MNAAVFIYTDKFIVIIWLLFVISRLRDLQHILITSLIYLCKCHLIVLLLHKMAKRIYHDTFLYNSPKLLINSRKKLYIHILICIMNMLYVSYKQ